MNVEFVLPTLSGTDMPKNDQAALLVNQAVAVIVCSYLEYAGQGTRQMIKPEELPTLIDSVQSALATLPVVT